MHLGNVITLLEPARLVPARSASLSQMQAGYQSDVLKIKELPRS